MHDFLQQMGKDIVWRESPQLPGERSRLWCYEDVLDVLTENTVCIILLILQMALVVNFFFQFKCGRKFKFGFCLNLPLLYFLLCSVIHLILCLIRGRKKFEA